MSKLISGLVGKRVKSLEKVKYVLGCNDSEVYIIYDTILIKTKDVIYVLYFDEKSKTIYDYDRIELK